MDKQKTNVDVLASDKALRRLVLWNAINGAGRALGSATVLLMISLTVVISNTIVIRNHVQDCQTIRTWRYVAIGSSCFAGVLILVTLILTMVSWLSSNNTVKLNMEGEVGEYRVSIPMAASAVAMTTSPRPVQICFGSWVISLVQWFVAGFVYIMAIGDGGAFQCSLTDETLEFVEVLGISASFLFTAFSLTSKADGKDRTFLDTLMMEFKPSKVSELFLDATTAIHVMMLTKCNKFVRGPGLEYATRVMGHGLLFDYSLRGHMLFSEVNCKMLWEAIEKLRGGQEMAISVSRYGVLRMEEKEEPPDKSAAGRAVANLMRRQAKTQAGTKQEEEQNAQEMAMCAGGALAAVIEVVQWPKTGRQMLKTDQRLKTGKYADWIVG